jgi:hypothetical protein
MGPKFFQTIAARSFFEVQVPRLDKELEKLSCEFCEFQRYNDTQQILQNQQQAIMYELVVDFDKKG